jgi:hypothetical protein
MPELDINPYIPKLDILNISTETIKKKLDNLKIDKSPGPDNLVLLFFDLFFALTSN